MCEFISWIKVENNVLFLTDKDVFSPHGRETLVDILDNDSLGHGAIRAFYGLPPSSGEEFENRDFWIKDNYPPEIAQYLESTETVISTWGKMLDEALQPDDALYALNKAPQTWKKALGDTLVKAVSKNAYDAYHVLVYHKSFTDDQKNTLIRGVSQDTYYAYCILCKLKGLTKDQKDILIIGVSRSGGYSYETLRDHDISLTEDQRKILQKVSD